MNLRAIFIHNHVAYKYVPTHAHTQIYIYILPTPHAYMTWKKMQAKVTVRIITYSGLSWICAWYTCLVQIYVDAIMRKRAHAHTQSHMYIYVSNIHEPPSKSMIYAATPDAKIQVTWPVTFLFFLALLLYSVVSKSTLNNNTTCSGISFMKDFQIQCCD